MRTLRGLFRRLREEAGNHTFRVTDPGRQAGGSPPRLSVIVPVFNVELYLAECLDSLLAQTFRDLEIVMVDDGSSDGSPDVAARYAEEHGNVRVVTTANRGLGAARNTGITHARGELLTFVDSDDVVPPRAYEAMVRTLDASGSEFVVGALERWTTAGLVMPPWMSRLHERRRLALTIEDLPELLGDVFACNKVFRRSFWDREGLRFPEGTRYEDQVILTRAYLTARSFDVVKASVYHWRIREDQSSITQRRHELDDVRDRMVTKRATLETVRQLGSQEVQEVLLKRVLAGDMPQYFRHIPGCDDAWWELLRSGVAELWGGRWSFADSHLRAQQRLVGWLVGQGRREDAEAVLAFMDGHPEGPPLAAHDGGLVARLPFCDDPLSGVPAHTNRVTDHDLGWDSWITEVGVEGSCLKLTGGVRLRRFAHSGPGPEVHVALTATDGARVPMQLAVRGAGAAGSAPRGVDRTEFEATLDLSRLASRSRRSDGPLIWVVELEWRVPEWQRTARFSRVQRRGSGLVLSHGLEGGACIDVLRDDRVGLRLLYRE